MRGAPYPAQVVVDRTLAIAGGGRVVVSGDGTADIVRAWRGRAVAAHHAVADSTAGAVDVWWSEHPRRPWDDAAVPRLLDEVATNRPRVWIVRVPGPREPWEGALLRHGWRKHPLYQQLVDYASIETESLCHLAFEAVPPAVTGADLGALAATRDLHMDMLRETGRRADAHVARYMMARQYVRPGDRVLDAACGLGYGSRLLADGTLATSVMGIDLDPWAVTYAREHYGRGRPRLSFDARDVACLDDLADGAFDVIVSFETVEHLADPEAFLAACRRLLTPGGRFVCSIPNEWLDERGVDPNPHHLHVFDRARLEATCRRFFHLERVYGQTAGGGMKLPDAPRALWPADDVTGDAEWWLAVGMTSPFATAVDPVPTRWMPAPATPVPVVVDFARDYAYPWLVRALVAIGQRTDVPDLQRALADETQRTASPGSADAGAALCVRAYRELDAGGGLSAGLDHQIEQHLARPAATPHAHRWHVSLRYVQGLARLADGDPRRAAAALEACVEADALAFSPLLATKTVGACWLLGWLALQDRDAARAHRWWRRGLDEAARAVQRPWDELVGRLDAPLLFGLREATQVMDLASQCAAGLHVLPQADDRPGVAWTLLADSLTARLDNAERALADLRATAADLQAQATAAWHRCRAAEALAEAAPRRAVGTWVLQTKPDVAAHVRIAIFGTGHAGRQALTRFRAHGSTVTCFADNDQGRWRQLIEGIPVVDPATLPFRDVDFVAVASAPGRDAIFRQLSALGYRPGRDFDEVPAA